MQTISTRRLHVMCAHSPDVQRLVLALQRCVMLPAADNTPQSWAADWLPDHPLTTPAVDRQRAAALSPQGGAVRVLEVGAGDGRLAHFVGEALRGPVAEGDGSAQAVGSTSGAAFGGCPGSVEGRSAGLAGTASAAAAPQILVSASDDGSLGLHTSSPYRSALITVLSCQAGWHRRSTQKSGAPVTLLGMLRRWTLLQYCCGAIPAGTWWHSRVRRRRWRGCNRILCWCAHVGDRQGLAGMLPSSFAAVFWLQSEYGPLTPQHPIATAC